MDRFLAAVERRAFRMAVIATGNRDDALDIVQDAMMKLVRNYANRDEQEWGPLFQRILQSTILDWYRRRKVRSLVMTFFGKNESSQEDELENIPHPSNPEPVKQLTDQEAISSVDKVISQLPIRQQQAFILRVWEEMSVNETATAMRCSEGSVKTHYSRAIHTLRNRLEEDLR